MFLDHATGSTQLTRVQPLILRQVQDWLKPELGFAARTLHMDVQTGFFPGEKVKPEPPLAEDGWTHRTQRSGGGERRATGKTGESDQILQPGPGISA